MKLILMIFGLTMVLTFGVITAVSSYTPAAAIQTGDDDVSFDDCHDDGDDDDEPADNPDNGEQGDGEDHDPGYEGDDEAECGVVGGETATPCPSIIYPATDEGCCPDYSYEGGDYTCVCPDSAGVNAATMYQCYCPSGTTYECLCQLGIDVPLCCEDWGYFCGGSLEAASTDVDCDGVVTAADAYASLAQLGGSAAEAASCGGGGDADCSGSVDALDTLAILKVLAGLSEPAAC